jgi:hypothetical protein
MSDARPNLLALFARSAAREEDIVAVVPPCEVWLLAGGAADALRQSVIPRLNHVLDQLQGEAPCQLGIAAFGADGTTPEQLFTAARTNQRDIPQASNRRAA